MAYQYIYQITAMPCLGIQNRKDEGMDVELLSQLQSVETNMLADIDQFCTENKIEYTLGYGTLLGAVRHGGPIPWDDDVDICMTRLNYEKFIKLWKESNNQDYYLQEEGPHTLSDINHAKIRKNHTLLATDNEMKESGHHGIWIDVFAMDKIPNDKKLRKKLLFWAKIRLVYTRNYPLTRNGKILEIISKIMLAVPKPVKRLLRNYSEEYVVKYKELDKNYNIICLAAPALLKEFYPENIMDYFIDMNYLEHKFKVVADYDKMLTIRYGNYMKYPPIEKQVCTHNPTYIQL